MRGKLLGEISGGGVDGLVLVFVWGMLYDFFSLSLVRDGFIVR